MAKAQQIKIIQDNVQSLLNQAKGNILSYFEKATKEEKQQLDNFIDILRKENLLKKQTLSKQTRWSSIMDTSYSLDIKQYNQYKNLVDLNKLFLDAYLFIQNFLSRIGIINPVQFTVTQIDDNYNYTRLSNLTIRPQNVILQTRNHGKRVSQRLKESSFQKEIKKAKEEEQWKLMNEHFQNFIKPYKDYIETNKTGWKINKGVLAEAFQRHLETVSHPPYTDPLPSIGARWWIYRLSSGSDPFFTGPDTKYAQVKTTSASLISDVNTLIYTLTGLQAILKGQITDEEKIQKIFKQADIKPTMTSKIWDGLEKGAKEEAQEAVKDFMKSLT